MKDLHDAVIAVHPNAAGIRGGTLDELTAIDVNRNPVTIDKTAVQAKLDSFEYINKRILAYPTIQDQLDMQYWDKKNGTTTWVDAVAKVKSDNPKP